MKISYVGRKEKFILDRPELSKKYDFSKGAVEVTAADAKILKAKFASSFCFPVEKPKDDSAKVTGK